MLKIVEVDVITGEFAEREATKEEIAQSKLDEKADKKRITNEQAALEVKAAAQESAKSKLAKLGLTEDEIAAIVGGM